MVRKLLAQTPDDSTCKLDLIDVIQRLGVEYHFKNEIEESLKYIHDRYKHQNSEDNDDLRIVALRFRLLRQEGYNVPCGKHVPLYTPFIGQATHRTSNDRTKKNYEIDQKRGISLLFFYIYILFYLIMD